MVELPCNGYIEKKRGRNVGCDYFIFLFVGLPARSHVREFGFYRFFSFYFSVVSYVRLALLGLAHGYCRKNFSLVEIRFRAKAFHPASLFTLCSSTSFLGNSFVFFALFFSLLQATFELMNEFITSFSRYFSRWSWLDFLIHCIAFEYFYLRNFRLCIRI
jgi:hypothetical protein